MENTKHCNYSLERSFCRICFFQDFVWAFGQVLAGVVTISLPIRYGASKFRNEIVNQVCLVVMLGFENNQSF